MALAPAYSQLVRAERGGSEQMIERAGVVAQHMPIPDTDSSSFSNDDAARFERLEGLRHGFGAGLDAEVGAGRAQRVDDRVGARFEVAARDRRPHGVGYNRRREYFVKPPDGRHDRVREVEHLAP